MSIMARLLRKARIWLGRSELNYLIPPEIKNDTLYAELARIAADPNVREILEIGASSGAGSTEALVAGAQENPTKPRLHCLEISRVRYEALVNRFAALSFVRCYNLSSVPLDQYPTEQEVIRFHSAGETSFSRVPRSEVLRWLDQDRRYVRDQGISTAGIRKVKESNNITMFDLVLIDGSEFTGHAELAEVYGARFLVLDDINSFKNHENYKQLCADPQYRVVSQSDALRNGFAVFEKKT